MTLLLTEIYVGTDMHDVTIIFAADRRITLEKNYNRLSESAGRIIMQLSIK